MSTAFIRNLLPCIGLAYGLQAAAGIPSIAAQTERFYDLSGSLTYISCTALSLYLPAYRARVASLAAGAAPGLSRFPSLLEAIALRNWRTVALSAAAGVWAARLGSFLYARISGEAGRDSRFDSIRGSPAKFSVAFTAQATWVSLVLLPVLAVNSLPATVFANLPRVMATDVIGIGLWVAGWTLEVTADRQKSAWAEEKKQKKHDEDFLTRGLWGSFSRHPNYAGEITLWTGVAITAAGVLARQPALTAMGLSQSGTAKAAAVAMAAISPAFTTFLLTQVSGIPMSEQKYDKRYGDRKDYQEWKRTTAVLFPGIY